MGVRLLAYNNTKWCFSASATAFKAMQWSTVASAPSWDTASASK